jgi:hypothetical protein
MKIDKHVIANLERFIRERRAMRGLGDSIGIVHTGDPEREASVTLDMLEGLVELVKPLVRETIFGEAPDTAGHIRRSAVAPEKREGGRHDAYTLHHPAFGQVTVVQWHGGGAGRMFGSDLGHHSGIRMSFYAAHLVRSDLSSDRTHAGALLLEVELSLSQWSRLVSSIGNGSGIPVTLAYRRDGPLVPCPQIAAPEASKKELHGEEMATKLRQRLDAITGHIGRLGTMIDEGKITKTELREIQRELARHAQQLPGSVQFVFDQFAEATEKIVDDARIEIETHVDGVARKLGYDSIRDMAPVLQLGAPKPEETS